MSFSSFCICVSKSLLKKNFRSSKVDQIKCKKKKIFSAEQENLNINFTLSSEKNKKFHKTFNLCFESFNLKTTISLIDVAQYNRIVYYNAL